MLEMFAQTIPLIEDAIFGKGTIALFDREKYLEVQQGSRIALPVKVGDPLITGSSSYQVIQTGDKVVKEIGEEVLGVAYFASAYPIKINEEVVGGMAVLVPKELMNVSEELQATSEELATALEQISASIENISSSAQQLATAGQTVSQSSQHVYEKAEETEEVVQYIDSVASDTKLLGLNASIEAARAGDIGRGFAVVATEIQKMAVSSAGSAKEIRKIVRGIRELIADMTKEISDFGGSTQEVSAAIQEISASIESLTLMSVSLQNLAQKL